MDPPLYSTSADPREESPPSNGSVDRKASDKKEGIQDSEYTYDGARPVHLSSKPKNIILFGETGVGKSSVINLMAGAEVAKTSPNLEGCTLDTTEYSFTFPGTISVRIFDTVGLEEPEMGVNTFFGAIVKAHQLITSLHSAGGIDLLLFCIRAGRITSAMQRSYHLFFEILCGGKVPLAIVVTHLEQQDVMEDWWGGNEATFKQYGIRSVAHACITAVPACIMAYAQKRAESQKTLRAMLFGVLGNPSSSYMQEKRSWLVAILELLLSFLTKKRSFTKKNLSRRLETECMLPRNDAQKLAQMLISRRDN